MKSGNLNFVEPSGPLRACNGTALPLLAPIYFDDAFILCFLNYWDNKCSLGLLPMGCLSRNSVLLRYASGRKPNVYIWTAVIHIIADTPCTHTSHPPWHIRDLVPTSSPTSPPYTAHNKSHRRHHHHKHQGLDPLIRSVSRVTAARANASSVFQLFSFLVVCSGMIWKGFGFVAFFASVKASSVCIE